MQTPEAVNDDGPEWFLNGLAKDAASRDERKSRRLPGSWGRDRTADLWVMNPPL